MVFLSYLIHNNHRENLFDNVLRELEGFKIISIFSLQILPEASQGLPASVYLSDLIIKHERNASMITHDRVVAKLCLIYEIVHN